jgi:hypothetical protein
MTMTEAEKELEVVLQKIRYDRQMQKKRLYESAKRARKAEFKTVAASKETNVS